MHNFQTKFPLTGILVGTFSEATHNSNPLLRLVRVVSYNLFCVDLKSQSTSSDISKQSEAAYCNYWGNLETEAEKRGSFQRLESNRSVPLL